MGGKGRRRREKNYRSAHGGYANTLPPPPDLSRVDALPSKLRKLISFTSSSLHDCSEGSNGSQSESKRSDSGHNKTERSSSKDKPSQAREAGDRDKCNVSSEPTEEIVEDVTDKKKRMKRKRGQADDLRFQSSVEESSRRKERRRKRQKEYKEVKKNKRKNANDEENVDFPRHEKVRFGDVVKAPPKLVALPKGLKTPQDISKERIRLQAVEAYRKRKGWDSRPGSHQPPLVDT